MLDLKFIRENPDLVRKSAEAKLSKIDIGQILSLDQKRRALLKEVEVLKEERNRANDLISKLKREGKSIEDILKAQNTSSQKIDEIDKKVDDIEKDISKIQSYIPNISHETVPIGKDASGNKIVREWGEERRINRPDPKDHEVLTKELGWVNFERGAKITGSAFPVYQARGARLERALINMMLDLHTEKHGYTEMGVPHLVNRASMFGTGQLPRLEEDMYRLKDEDFFLIPTAEVPVTNLHRDETFAEKDLPVKYAAYTPCFRREAGSYGRDTKGLSRVHQFDKVELVKFVKPSEGLNELESLVKDAEAVLQLLGLKYRVLLLCSAELSFAGAKGYDLEAWAPVSKRWFEVSSCTWFSDFQARRMNIRYRAASGRKSELVHTLNGSGVALARTVLCLLETYQNASGGIDFPKALAPYLD